ncbi:hypothetical protein ADK57_46340 [Streptomyces sp. MMG1533]|nr:hypothetical protein ADK57_46340 [Streptomyces sp. MMG1533]
MAVGEASAPAAEDEASTMPRIESRQAFGLMEQRFPGTHADSTGARVVFLASDGQPVITAENRAVTGMFVTEASDGPQVSGAVGPFQAGAVSKDGSTAYSTVAFTERADDLADRSRQHLEDAVDRARPSASASRCRPRRARSSRSSGWATEPTCWASPRAARS